MKQEVSKLTTPENKTENAPYDENQTNRSKLYDCNYKNLFIISNLEVNLYIEDLVND